MLGDSSTVDIEPRSVGRPPHMSDHAKMHLSEHLIRVIRSAVKQSNNVMWVSERLYLCSTRKCQTSNIEKTNAYRPHITEPVVSL